jgi:flavin-dependent dehydrogenase
MKIDIVGGSLSGLSTAITIKELDKSIDVTVHEKYKKIGYNHEGRRCGEAIALYKKMEKWQPSKTSIFNQINKVDMYVVNKKFEMPIPRSSSSVYMIDRQEFIAQLAKKAKRLDVNIQTNNKISTLEELDGDYIVDGSGCPSTIKRILGINRGIIATGYQQTLENSNRFKSNILELYFIDTVGYYWVFPRNPKNKEINVGIGVMEKTKINHKDQLEKFKQKFDIKGDCNYIAGGLIPVGLQRPFEYKNILFVGDAGVGTFPITGEGIYRALLSGEIAGKCIAKKCPNKYSITINKEFIIWEIIGKFFVHSGDIFKKIGEKAFSKSLKLFFKIYSSWY